MKTHCVRTLLVLGAVLVATLAPLQSHAAPCSTASGAGRWAYTYTGTIFTPNGPLPAAAVGHYRLDAAGNLTGTQSRSVAGQSGEEDIIGNVATNSDCTATATIAAYVNGQLQRTAVLAVVYDTNMNHARGIFQSLVLPNGTNVPVVITSDNSRLVPRD
jgi:hypothetical protein